MFIVLCTVQLQAMDAPLRLLPAMPPSRPDAVAAGLLKVRFTPEAVHDGNVETVAQRNGLVIERVYLPYAQSLASRLQTMMPNAAPSARALMLDERLRRSYVVRYDTAIG
jgi:hypothetical protein